MVACAAGNQTGPVRSRLQKRSMPPPCWYPIHTAWHIAANSPQDEDGLAATVLYAAVLKALTL